MPELNKTPLGPQDYDRQLRMAEKPLSESPWLKLYCHALVMVSTVLDGYTKEHRTICDLGCGTGRFAKMLMQCGYTEYMGIDFSPVRVQMAEKYCAGMGGWFMDEDVMNPVIQNSFQQRRLFVALELLEHISDDLGLLRALPSGAHVVVSVPNFEGRRSGHVRWFEKLSDVLLRYGNIIDIVHSQMVPAAKGRNCFYLFCGVCL